MNGPNRSVVSLAPPIQNGFYTLTVGKQQKDAGASAFWNLSNPWCWKMMEGDKEIRDLDLVRVLASHWVLD